MRVLLEFRRRGASYEGSLTRVTDHVTLPFAGLLELVAVLERLDAEQPTTSDDTDRPQPGPIGRPG